MGITYVENKEENMQNLQVQDFIYAKSYVTSQVYPYQLPAGEKQRVASARAIVTNSLLILADEPTGILDSKSARILLESIETLNKEMNATIFMVTYDAFTASYCDRILFIKDGKIFNEIIK